MRRLIKPYLKASHNAWYVNLDGKQIRLADTEGEALERYGDILKQRKKNARFLPPGAPVPYRLGRLKSEFFASAFRDRSPSTKTFYAAKLDPFVDHLGEDFPIADMKPLHVEDWIAAHPRWKKGTARQLWQAVQRLLRWGEKSGRTPHSSVCDYRKPGPTRRTTIISPDDYRMILANSRSEQFRNLVTVAWEVGARPQELLRAQTRHYEPRTKRLVFPQEEAKVDSWPRVVYLTDEAVAIVERLIAQQGNGHIFRNLSGRAWTPAAVNCEWTRIRQRLGFAVMKQRGIVPTEPEIAAKIRTLSPTLKERGKLRKKTASELREEARLKCRQQIARVHAPRYCLYNFRHSWLDRMLKKGVDVLTCAILLGHRDPSMIAKTYQHLSQSPDYLRAALNKAG